ncbi:MAG TPA: GNA1162 family protein [Candidatus Binataceae bacterium]|nr:GNA1162 family protein [Candidatus Binataceae bacterium]
MRRYLILCTILVLTGCAAHQPEDRPFFQQEYDTETHGRKTILDRLVETDPGAFHVDVAPQYEADPPERIAVLPFGDLGSANFVVDKIPLTHRNQLERYNWAWTDGQRLRRAMQGYLAEREFVMDNLIGVDAVLKQHGIDSTARLNSISPQQLGQWLDVDAVVYGNVLHYESYYFFLFAAWQVGIETRIVSTHTGKTLIHATGSRWDDQLLPAIDIMDIAINSGENLLQLRDINLARAEEEACREIVIRIPQSPKLKHEESEQAIMYANQSDLARELANSAELPKVPGP